MCWRVFYSFFVLHRSCVLFGDGLVDFCEGDHFLGIDQLVLTHKQEKVAVRRIEVHFKAQRTHLCKVVVVYMSVDPEQAAQNRLDAIHKVGWERGGRLNREQRLIINLRLCPIEQALDVVGCRQAGRATILDRGRVLPMVLEAGPCAHDGALARRTKLGERAIQDIQVVEKVHRVQGEPLFQQLAVWHSHSHT